MFTYYSIIGRDIDLLKGHVENVKNYAGFDRLTCEKEFLMIVYKNSTISDSVTSDILSFCEDNNIKTHVYEEPNNNFLTNLYACWNLGYEKAMDGYVFRGGSDQFFSKDSFLKLYDQAVKFDRCILQANTVENLDRTRELGAQSRHFCKSFGQNFSEMKVHEFEAFCDNINKNAPEVLDINTALSVWGKPTSFTSSIGHINRTDGCSWLMKKSDWEEFGPMPPIENGITGDVVIHDRMQTAGYENYIVRDCVTYHFVRGESKDIQ
tara:strand:+ start:326 stop:1120 length:795 start_codon:yes stop_codon:yes gene_type:complete